MTTLRENQLFSKGNIWIVFEIEARAKTSWQYDHILVDQLLSTEIEVVGVGFRHNNTTIDATIYSVNLFPRNQVHLPKVA